MRPLALAALALLGLALVPAPAAAHHDDCGPYRMLHAPVEVHVGVWLPALGASCYGVSVETRLGCPLGAEGSEVAGVQVALMEDFTGWCSLAGVWLPA